MENKFYTLSTATCLEEKPYSENKDLFEEVSEDQFRLDLSSTEI